MSPSRFPSPCRCSSNIPRASAGYHLGDNDLFLVLGARIGVNVLRRFALPAQAVRSRQQTNLVTSWLQLPLPNKLPPSWIPPPPPPPLSWPARQLDVSYTYRCPYVLGGPSPFGWGRLWFLLLFFLKNMLVTLISVMRFKTFFGFLPRLEGVLGLDVDPLPASFAIVYSRPSSWIPLPCLPWNGSRNPPSSPPSVSTRVRTSRKEASGDHSRFFFLLLLVLLTIHQDRK